MEITRQDGMTIGIGAIPERKRQALYLLHGCSVNPVAYFDTDDHADEVSSFLVVMATHTHDYLNALKRIASVPCSTPHLKACGCVTCIAREAIRPQA
jgi:hypothetical protein